MRWHLSLAAVILTVAIIQPVQAQPREIKDAADLLPAQTLAYLELRQPDQLGKEIAALIKDSALENIPLTMAKFRAKYENLERFWVLQEVSGFGLMLSPEVLSEAARLQGAAVAITGFDKENQPEIVGFVLAGQSHAPTFAMRAYLSMDQLRVVTEVDKVPLYRQHGIDFRNFQPVAPGGAAPQPQAPAFHGPTFALLPGMIVIGSTTESVKEIVHRFQAKTATPALSSVSGFKEAAKMRDRPGLFGYADCAALLTQFDSPQQKGLPFTDYEWEVFKTLVNPKVLRSLAGSLTLQNGDLQLRLQANLDPSQASPFLELLSDQAVNLEVLHAAPKDSMIAMTMSLPDGAKRFEKIVGLADAVAKVGKKPENLWPSKHIAELEKKLKLSLAKDFAGKIAGVGVVMNVRAEMFKGDMPPLPMIILNATSDTAAKDLEEAAPKLLALFGKEESVSPSRETIEGKRISSLPGEGFPWGATLHFGRQGTAVVFGTDRKAVVASLTAMEKKAGLFGEPKFAESLKKFDGPIILGTWSLGESIVQALDWERSMKPAQAKMPAPPGGAPVPAPKPGEKDDSDEKYIKDLLKAVEPLPPATIAVMRKKDTLSLEIRQSNLKSVSAKLINIVVDATLERLIKGKGVLGVGGGNGQ